jgi:enoyl-CoA hydratase/carnithine racemase
MTTQEFTQSHSRIPIFSYNTLLSALIPKTKTLEIKFKQIYFNQEMLFELESILAWSATHQEIQSIYITTLHDSFIQGVDVNEIKKLSPEKCAKFLLKISTISESLLCLPQTIIIDMKNGAKGAGLEVAMAADIRISNSNAQYKFNYLSQGLVPTAGLFSFLRPYLNQNILRSLLLTEKVFNNSEMLALGCTTEINQSVDSLLELIASQSPVARIQTKLGLQNNQKDIQENILNAVLFTEDYQQKDNFMLTSVYKEKIREIN